MEKCNIKAQYNNGANNLCKYCYKNIQLDEFGTSPFTKINKVYGTYREFIKIFLTKLSRIGITRRGD